MSFGIDCTAVPSIAAMRGANPSVDFVCRYVGYFSGYNLNDIAAPQGKVLTPGEAKMLNQAGIAIVSNFEWYNTRAIDDGLGHTWTLQEAFDAGVWDAQTAQKIHAACGGPDDRPIFFSVDFNTGVTAAILAYFRGIASVLGLERTGAYGGYRIIKALFDAGVIRWGWQTYAWSGDEWDPRAQIKQYQNGMTFDGRSVDYDRSMVPDFGQWGGNTMLQITDPLVGDFFEELDANHWQCKNNNSIIQYGNLKLYRSVKSGQAPDLAGLTLFGLPKGNETPIDGEGNTEQPYERCKVRYDPKHRYDNPPGAGASYTVHIDTPAPTPPPPVVNPDVVTQLHTIETASSTALKDLDAAS